MPHFDFELHFSEVKGHLVLWSTRFKSDKLDLVCNSDTLQWRAGACALAWAFTVWSSKLNQGAHFSELPNLPANKFSPANSVYQVVYKPNLSWIRNVFGETELFKLIEPRVIRGEPYVCPGQFKPGTIVVTRSGEKIDELVALQYIAEELHAEWMRLSVRRTTDNANSGDVAHATMIPIPLNVGPALVAEVQQVNKLQSLKTLLAKIQCVKNRLQSIWYVGDITISESRMALIHRSWISRTIDRELLQLQNLFESCETSLCQIGLTPRYFQNVGFDDVSCRLLEIVSQCRTHSDSTSNRPDNSYYQLWNILHSIEGAIVGVIAKPKCKLESEFNTHAHRVKLAAVKGRKKPENVRRKPSS